MRPLRVLEVLEATTAGTGKHLFTLLRGLDRSLFEVEVASPLVRGEWQDKGDTRFVDRVRALGVPVHAVDLRRGIDLIADTKGLIALYRLMRRGKYVVVHVHSSKAGFLGRIAAKLNGIRTVYTPNGLYFLNPRSALSRRFFLLLEQVAGLLTDRLIAVSESERRIIVQNRTVPDRKIAVIPNAVDGGEGFRPNAQARQRVREELRLRPEIFVVGTASRYSRQKDPTTFVQAARYVLDRDDSTRFVWCGEGERRRQTEEFAREIGVFGAFHFLGFRHDIQDVMNAFDLFALSSIYEGMPYVLLEAMLLELPVVATDVVGNRDVVVSGETGILVPPSNPEAMGVAVLELAHDPVRRRTMGQRGASLVRQRNGVQDMVTATQRVYRALGDA